MSPRTQGAVHSGATGSSSAPRPRERRHVGRGHTVAWSLAALCLTGTLRAAELQLERSESPLPETVSAEIGQALGATALRVTAGGNRLADFWLRTALPAQESAPEQLGVSFGRLKEATLVGVVRLHDAWSDYKGNPVAAGVYTLRYAIEPADGNHMGVSIYRDFLLLVPAAEDGTVEVPWTPDELSARSRAATGTPHPAVLALFPIWEERTEAGLVRNEVDQWTLAVPFASVSPTLGLVLEGHGEV